MITTDRQSNGKFVQNARGSSTVADVYMAVPTIDRRGSMPSAALDDDSVLDLTVFVSCHNEADHIVNTLDTICAAANELQLSFEIIVVDDRSRDDSGQIVRGYIDAHPHENVILRANRTNRGLAQNYLDGAFLGKGRYYRLVTGDSPESKENMIQVFSEIGKADCIVPYYKHNRGRKAYRRLISNGFTAVVNLITGNSIHYYNGLTVHRRRNVQRWHTNTKGFGFQTEILCLLLDNGYTYKEVAIELPVSAFALQDSESRAFNIRNFLSVMHTVVEVTFRRLSDHIYGRR
jgi:glycosyltransferase involved in cell wall biosynthesis